MFGLGKHTSDPFRYDFLALLAHVHVYSLSQETKFRIPIRPFHSIRHDLSVGSYHKKPWTDTLVSHLPPNWGKTRIFLGKCGLKVNVARVYKFGSLNDTKNSLGVNMVRVYQFRVFGNNNPFFAGLALPSNLGIRSKLIESSSMIHCVESKRTSCMRAPPENWCSRRVEKVQFRHWTPEVPARAYRSPTTQHKEIPSSNIWISFVKGFNAVRDTVMLYISIPARMR